jgi:hypothetical protein
MGCAAHVSLKVVFWTALVLAVPAWAQQPANPPEPLVLLTGSLPKAGLKEPYRFVLRAQGGLPPVKWEVTAGSLPEGIVLDSDGTLHGTPAATGEYEFTVTASDTGQPPQQEAADLVLRVVVPLFAKWSRTPAVNGRRIEAAVKISNNTDADFDLTVIAMAVNEIGRATALGYQHIVLNRNTKELEVPFGETLSPGAYQVNVDVVAEVPETGAIHRTRLAVTEPLQIAGAP